MPYIKLLTVLAGLAFLTACGGAAPPNAETSDNDKTGDTAVSCDTNPFGSTCLADANLNPRRVGIVSDCRTDKMGDLCEDAIEFVCDNNFRDSLCDGIKEYEDMRQVVQNECLKRATQTQCDEEERVEKCDARPFFDDCIEPKYVMQRRAECESLKNKSQCMATEELICGANGDVFDPFCNGITNYVSVRETTCQTHGTDPNDGDPSCATILIPFCTIADPFAHAGCDSVANINAEIRTPYCQTLANAWNPKCMDGTHGTVSATRVTACQMFGTNTDMGGDDSCATSLTTACDIRDPFAYTGCNNVAGIAGVRMMYCETPATAWDAECMQTIHGNVTNKRGEACLKFGIDTITGGHATCISNTVAESSCRINPFDPLTMGCAILTEFPMIVKTYCMTNDVADCPNATFGDWVKGFGDNPPPATLTAGKNQFLSGTATELTTTGATNAPSGANISLTLASAMFNGAALLEAGDASDGVAFFYDTVAANDYNYYAGILSNTDLGALITGAAATTAKWEGQFRAVLDNSGIMTHNEDFVLDITFNGNTGSIESYVLIDAGEGAYYHVEGTYDDQGVISGSVDFGEFTGVGTATITPGDENSEGILTGLIGEQGAVGAFIGGTGTKEALADLTSDKISYVGGFVAAPYVEPTDTTATVALNDWTGSFRRYPPPATIDLSNAGTDIFGSFLNIATGETTIATTSLKTEASGSTASESVILPLAVGNDMDGVVYIGGFNGDNSQAFVGLLPTTDLGAPFAVSDTEAEWEGFYYDSTLTTAQNAITFDIDFTARSIGVKADSITAASPPVFALGFNSAGVITGTVTKDSIEATALGLIGAEGLVGAFIDTAPTTGNVFHGGFVATPPVVNHADWLGSFGVSPPPATRVAANAGTAAFGSFLNLGDGVRVISETDLTNVVKGTLTLDGDGTNGMHGVTYLVGRNDMMRDQAFVAVLPTTNLGAPLVAQPTIGRWPGTYYNSSFSSTQPVNFDIVFGANTINGTHDATTPFPLVTTFTLRFSDTGVITGTVAQGVGNTATASGLIGTNGLVGVFVDETPSQAASTSVFFGGFIADNPNN